MRRLLPLLLTSVISTTGCDRSGAPALGRAPSGGPTPSAASVSASAAPSSPALASAASKPSAAPEVPPEQIVAIAEHACASAHAGHIATSPLTPVAGAPLRVLSTVDGAPPTSIVVRPPSGAPRALAAEPKLGPPASVFGEVDAPVAGTYRIVVSRGTEVLVCADVVVAEVGTRTRRSGTRSQAPWEATRAWTQADEDLYSAWIERLFDAPLSEQPSFDALYRVTSDPKKNFLHDHFARDEDDPPPRGLNLDPDCADLPYFLRAYFAWKEGLPFGFSSCTRGTQGHAPACLRHFSSLEAMDDPPHDPVRKFEKFVRSKLADTVHSGTGRTGAEDDATDYYPVEIATGKLRPGTIYADPYGHVLVVAKIIPQTADAGGLLLAVDGQPDGTVGRKRFWEGNFLFSLDDVAMGSPGFKRFRKVVAKGDDLRLIHDDALAKDPAYADFGLNQYAGGGAQAFYDLMDDALSPVPRDPEKALLETLQALEEQVKTRLISVGNGADRFEKKTSVIEMPTGPSIFETTGEWEDFSTPSRDLRLLIAIDVATGFPARYARRPDRFRAQPGKSIEDQKAALTRLLETELRSRKVTYRRSDGTDFTLTLADVVARQKALEIAYNPNDCIEWRWGAPQGSDESKTCHRHAPADQRQKMEKVRAWFSERKRPARK